MIDSQLISGMVSTSLIRLSTHRGLDVARTDNAAAHRGRDDDGGVDLGWVLWDEMGEFAEPGDYLVPATFYDAPTSSASEPSCT